MANIFKRYAKANVNTLLGSSATEVYAIPSTGSVPMKSIIIGITLSNTSSDSITANVFLDNFDVTNDVYIARNVYIPTGSTLEIMSGNKIVVQGNGTNNDTIRVSCSNSNSLDVVISVLEDV
jgi:hypothetical protein